jgi:iron complex outermembrane receptor protein
MSPRRYSLATAIAVALHVPLPAAAQSAGTQLEEIVVTAQKRLQNFNDVGVTVSVVGGSDLAELGIVQLNELATQMPNVQIKNVVANSVPNITIRGIGLNDYAANNNPAAGMYVDDVYLVSPAMLSFGLFDLERVEVLKGPQGTLFGRNTTAGAVNFISRKPTDVLSGYLTVDYGNYESAMVEGAIGGPITDDLGGRVAVQTVQRGSGYQTNRLTGEKVGEIDRTSARGLLAWSPADNLDFLLSMHAGTDESDVDLVKIDNPFTTEDDGDTNVYRSGASIPTRMELDSKGVALSANWELSDTLTLTSVTGFEDFSRLHIEDRDATSLQQLDGYFDNEIEQFSQEVRLSYLTDNLVLIGGAFYGEDSVDTRDRFDAEDLLGLLGLAGVQSLGNEYSQDTTSAALFLHSEWTFRPDWKLTAGARYTDDQKDFSNAFTYLISGGTEIQLFPPLSEEYDVQDVSGKIGLDYSGFEDTLLYASISRGFKSGGFQGQLTFDPAALEPFDDETLLAYEAGIKKGMLGNTLQFNASAFFYDYSDMQFYGGLFDSPVGVLFGITNVGDAEVMGAEMELWWKASEQLDLRAGLGLLDTEITKSVVDGVATGSELPNSPELTFNALVRYHWPLTDSLRAEFLLTGNYMDDVSFDIVRNPPEAVEEGYWLADASFGLGAPDSRWEVTAWVKNLADERYRTQVLFSSVGFGESWGAPRTYGLSLTFNL